MSVQYFWKALKAFSSKDLYKLQEWHPGDFEYYSEMISQNYCSINQQYFRFRNFFGDWSFFCVELLEVIYLCFEFLPSILALLLLSKLKPSEVVK
jgi:hypothetical protein